MESGCEEERGAETASSSTAATPSDATCSLQSSNATRRNHRLGVFYACGYTEATKDCHPNMALAGQPIFSAGEVLLLYNSLVKEVCDRSAKKSMPWEFILFEHLGAVCEVSCICSPLPGCLCGRPNPHIELVCVSPSHIDWFTDLTVSEGAFVFRTRTPSSLPHPHIWGSATEGLWKLILRRCDAVRT